MRVHVLVSVPLTRTRLSRPSPDCAFIHVITCSHSTLGAVGAHDAWARTFTLIIYTGTSTCAYPYSLCGSTVKRQKSGHG